METKSYLEIKTPISSDAQWLCELKKTVHGEIGKMVSIILPLHSSTRWMKCK